MQEHIKMLDESKKMKIIKKTVVDVLGNDETEKIWDTARERLREILSRYENIPPKEQMHTNLIFPHIAVYKSLLENHSSMAMEIMEKGETAAAEKTVKLFKNVVKLPLGKAIFLKGFAAGCKSGFGSDAGFRHVIRRADSKCYQMDVTACPYMKYCNAEGCGELTRIFCDIDVYAYGYLDGITFERTETLGTGGEKCDFHLHLSK